MQNQGPHGLGNLNMKKTKKLPSLVMVITEKQTNNFPSKLDFKPIFQKIISFKSQR